MADTPQNDLRASGGPAFDTNLLLGSIEFRVVRSGSAPRRMRINTTRCTLGSGEGCTVRLNDASIRPMHAVLLRDANRVLLRAYTVPIEVNGHLCGETFLHIGDRFVLGSYQFELVHSPVLTANLGENNPFFTERVESDNLRAAGIRDQSAGSWSGEPRRTKSSAFPQEESEEHVEARLAPPAKSKKRGRLSFLGGGGYVSEAIQSLAVSSHEPAEDSFGGSPRDHTDQLVLELTAYKKREQQWKAQDAQTGAELAEANDRFHQSQERAKESSDARSTAMRERDEAQQATERALLAQQLNAQTQRGDEPEANHADLICRHEALQNSLEAINLQSRQTANEFAQTQQKMDSLSKELAKATEKLHLAREEAAAAANDKKLIESLQSQLSNSESRRSSDQSSWEQEAIQLQASIEQLSIDLSAATSRLSQTEGEHDATQTELNDAYGRLTTVRRELAARPTNEQWDDLQEQLVKTEHQLAETEKQLVTLRRDYDDLLACHSAKEKAEAQSVPSTAFAATSIPMEQVVQNDQSVEGLASNLISMRPEPQIETQEENGDHGWPKTCMLSQMPPHDYATFENSGSTVFPEERPARDEEDDEDGGSGVQNEIPDYEPVPATENPRFSAESREPALGSTVPESEPDDVVNEDSIEAYMNRLLQRVQGHSGVDGEKSPAAPTAIEMKSEKTNRLTPNSDSRQIGVDTAVVIKTVEVIAPNTPLVPRSQTPEDAGHLAAMRELANASAHSAISVSARGQSETMKSRAIMDLMQAGVIMVCGFAFYTCGLKIPSLKNVWFTASALAILLVLLFLFEMVKKLAAAKITYEGYGDRQNKGEKTEA